MGRRPPLLLRLVLVALAGDGGDGGGVLAVVCGRRGDGTGGGWEVEEGVGPGGAEREGELRPSWLNIGA